MEFLLITVDDDGENVVKPIDLETLLTARATGQPLDLTEEAEQ